MQECPPWIPWLGGGGGGGGGDLLSCWRWYEDEPVNRLELICVGHVSGHILLKNRLEKGHLPDDLPGSQSRTADYSTCWLCWRQGRRLTPSDAARHAALCHGHFPQTATTYKWNRVETFLDCQNNWCVSLAIWITDRALQLSAAIQSFPTLLTSTR